MIMPKKMYTILKMEIKCFYIPPAVLRASLMYCAEG